MPKKRKIRVVYSKLAREKVWGYSHSDGWIELDERLMGKKHLEVLIHESIHQLYPDSSEEEVEWKAIVLTNTLWSQMYRRIDNTNPIKLQDGKK